MLKQLLAAAVLLSSISACSAGASLVRRDAVGGRVQLDGAYMPAMADARLLMVEHCQGRFETVELGKSVEFHCKGAGTQHSGANTYIASP